MTDSPDNVTTAVWSHDGSRISYYDRTETAYFIMEVDKGWDHREPMQLPPLGDGDFGVVSWSPDGKWLAGNGARGAPAPPVLSGSRLHRSVVFRVEP